jgi:hypothetical protein
MKRTVCAFVTTHADYPLERFAHSPAQKDHQKLELSDQSDEVFLLMPIPPASRALSGRVA